MWLLFYALTAVLYLPFLAAPYFSDDLLFIFTSPPAHLYSYFFMVGEAAHAYRPAESIILTWIQAHYRLNTTPIHLVSIAAHATLCCAVWVLAARLGFRRFERIAASALMLATQFGPPALLGNDTMSQAMGTALGAVGCVLLAIAYLDSVERPGSRPRRPLLLASLLAISAGYFFKETALAFLLTAGLLTASMAMRERGWPARIGFAARQLAPYAVLAALYFALRVHAHAPVAGGADIYQTGVGMNVVKNLAQFGYSLLAPVSTVSTALAAAARDFRTLVLSGLAVLAIAMVLAAGVLFSRRRLAAALLAGCAMSGLFPAVLLQHVSELYVYNSTPWMALLLGLALGELWRRGTPARVAALACAVLLLAGQSAADRQKAALMNANGESATRLIAAVVDYMKQLPPNSEIILTEEAAKRPKYSVYVLHGLDVLRLGAHQIGPIYGRPDIQVKIAAKTELGAAASSPHRLILELKDGSFSPL